VTRDRLLAAVTALVMLTACGNGNGNGSGSEPDATATSPAATPEASSSTEAATAPTAPVTSPTVPTTTEPDANSTPTVPATSLAASTVGERVVVLAEEFILADVLALGIKPVASTVAVVDAGFQGLDRDDTSGIEALPMTTLSLEHLASLQPDTIITLDFWVDQIGEDTLTSMGDLIAIPDGLGIPDRLAFLGDQLDRADEAASLIADLDEATRLARQAVPDDCTVSLAAIYPGPAPAAFVAGPWDLPTTILSTGCALDPDADEATPDDNGRVYLSLEQLPMLDAPTLVLLQSDTVEGEQAALDAIEANPLWAHLPAVRSGDVVVFDRLGYPGLNGQIRFLQDFTAALD
jgi:iron complex transport system substrate-binding protein